MMTEVFRTPDGTPFVRTADHAFADLPEFDFAPNYLETDGLRMHYVDAGPRSGPIALLMHGMPTWSFLNRHIINALTRKGWRCIAADHIGFGRSDKVTDETWYSLARHVEAHRGLIERLNLRDITLFCQDWGGPIGLAQPVLAPERFSRLVIMNTWLHHAEYPYSDALRLWRSRWEENGLFASNIPERLSIGWFMMIPFGYMKPANLFAIIQTGAHPSLPPGHEAVRRGYDAPFFGLDRSGHAGVRRFPLSLPFANPEGGGADLQARCWRDLLSWKKPVHFIWGGTDDIFTEGWGRSWASRFPQATFDILPDAFHFLQETHGTQIADIFLKRAAEPVS
jgi:haloalkane dehalogenase